MVVVIVRRLPVAGSVPRLPPRMSRETVGEYDRSGALSSALLLFWSCHKVATDISQDFFGRCEEYRL
jgi:hypothetical protein